MDHFKVCINKVSSVTFYKKQNLKLPHLCRNFGKNFYLLAKILKKKSTFWQEFGNSLMWMSLNKWWLCCLSTGQYSRGSLDNGEFALVCLSIGQYSRLSLDNGEFASVCLSTGQYSRGSLDNGEFALVCLSTGQYSRGSPDNGGASTTDAAPAWIVSPRACHPAAHCTSLHTTVYQGTTAGRRHSSRNTPPIYGEQIFIVLPQS